MPTFKAPPKTRRCPCGQWLAPTRIADGLYRCSCCVDTFAKSPPRKLDPKLLQGTMFERDARPTTAPREIVAVPTGTPLVTVTVDQPAAPSAVDWTEKYAAKLAADREKAAADVRGARLLEFIKSGLSLAEAIEQIEGRTHDHDHRT